MADKEEKPKRSIWALIRFLAVILVIGVIVASYVCVAVVIHDSKFADAAVLCPNYVTEKLDINFAGVKRKSLSIPTPDGQTLDAWLFVVPGAKSLAIVSHGNAGNLTMRGFVAQGFVQAKTNCLLYDYRGYGKSTGTPTLHGLLEDGDTVYNYAKTKLGYPANKLVEYGESIGSTVACHVAANNPCGGLMLFAPLDSLPSAGKWKIPILSIYPDFCFGEQLNNLELMTKIHAPICIFHGKKDETVNPAGSQRLYDAANQPKTLVYLPDSSHNEMSNGDGELYLQSIAKFMATLK